MYRLFCRKEITAYQNLNRQLLDVKSELVCSQWKEMDIAGEQIIPTRFRIGWVTAGIAFLPY